MFVRKEVNANFLRDLDAMLGPELSTLASLIADAYSNQNKPPAVDSEFHFIYFDPSSLSLRTSFLEPIGESTKSSALPRIPANVCV